MGEVGHDNRDYKLSAGRGKGRPKILLKAHATALARRHKLKSARDLRHSRCGDRTSCVRPGMAAGAFVELSLTVGPPLVYYPPAGSPAEA
jgi:hypothetical protein